MSHEYIGSLHPEQLLREIERERKCSSLKEIYAIVANGACDTGKGRLVGSIASILGEETFIIKYDPMVGTFPEDLGLIFQGSENNQIKQIGRPVTDDFDTYLGLEVNPGMIYNLVEGDVLRAFCEFAATRPMIGQGEQKKLTTADRSFFLAETILHTIKETNPRALVIEIGGIVEDQEQSHLAATLRFIGIKTGIIPQIVGLTYLEGTETNSHAIKTQIARNGIREIMKKYPGLPLHSVFIRRRFLSPEIPAEKIQQEILRIAYETAVHPDILVFMENVPNGDPEQIKGLILNSNRFHAVQ